MKISFTEYCEEYLDLHVDLMSDDEIKSARASYAEINNTEKQEKSEYEIKKHRNALEKAKESRKLAKFYGGKALTGSAAQKKWAEDIREKVLQSTELTEDDKIKLVTSEGIQNTAKFWINNKDKTLSAFKVENILSENKKLIDLYNKHYETLARTNSAHKRDIAKKEIYETLLNLSLNIKFDFPNCDFYNVFGDLKKDLKFRC